MVATKYVCCVSTVVGVTSRCDVAVVRDYGSNEICPSVSSVGV